MRKPNAIVCGLAAGPLIVVIAGLITMVIAFRGADPVLPHGERTEQSARAPHLLPALAGRNRAAEGLGAAALPSSDRSIAKPAGTPPAAEKASLNKAAGRQ